METHQEEAMSVTAVSNFSISPGAAPVPRRTQQDDAGRQLLEALNQGNLDAAQQAYGKLASLSSSSAGPFGGPGLNQQFQALGQAIQSGDLAAAQQTAQTLGQNLIQGDITQAQQAYSSKGWPGAKNSVENLAGDYWAVYGKNLELPDQPPTVTPTTGQSVDSVNLNA
jgi:hypothetical protein